MGWLDETPDKEKKVALLVALRDITDGKIYVEAERAKLTRMLAKVRCLICCVPLQQRSAVSMMVGKCFDGGFIPYPPPYLNRNPLRLPLRF